MQVIRKLLLGFVLLTTTVGVTMAQCESWVGQPNETKIKEAHVLYRGLAKGKDAATLAALDDINYGIVYDNWKIAYAGAPAADGNRSYHFTDGVDILKAKKQRAGTTDEEKKALDAQILQLWDQYGECFPDKKGVSLGRKAIEMFYMPAYGYRPATLDAFKEALNSGRTDLEYIVLEPIGQLVNYLFKNNQLEQVEARELLIKAIDLADHNIANNDTYKVYYESSKARMEAAYKESESGIFDCNYFKGQLMPIYRENKDSLDVLKYVYLKMLQQGCDTTDAQVLEVKTTYEALAAEINAKLQAEFIANNPGVAANNLYKEEKFEEAIAKYEEAIAKETDDTKKGEYYFSIASIQFRKLNQVSTARATARKAADLKPNWGRPYLLIGDMYASSTSCRSDNYGKGLIVLAAISKYSYAKSIDSDPDVVEDANRKIGLYNGSIPLAEEAFQRSHSDGQSINTGCWVSETVTLRTRKD
jgi:tetratricopeptide (TPR) repeat protein